MTSRARKKPLTLLHTSDWHIGRALCNHRRYEEFEAFLHWLAKTIDDKDVDVLVVAGDVFDTALPSNRSQELYYEFLHRVACKDHHVIVVGGNHDSPTFLDAPRSLLKALNVHVVGAAKASPSDEVLLISAEDGAPMMLVCAVPYLRDRDVRLAFEGESTAEKDDNLKQGIALHYSEVFEVAEKMRRQIDPRIPVVATGHLYTKGGETVANDGVRELYVGSLARVDDDTFPSDIDYLALGHLHIPQIVGTDQSKRYCGAPLHMGFDELGYDKQVVLVTFEGRAPSIERLTVPCFQEKRQIQGELEEIIAKLGQLRNEAFPVWVEVIYDGEAPVPNLRELLYEMVEESNVTILRIRNARVSRQTLAPENDDDILENLTVHDVFQRCLDAHEIPEEQRGELVATFKEIVRDIETDDTNAE